LSSLMSGTENTLEEYSSIQLPLRLYALTCSLSH
jgi:hypothetical protein